MRRLAAVTANDAGGDAGGDDGGEYCGDGDNDNDNDGDCDSEDKGGGCNEEGDVNTRYETKMMAIEEEEVYEKTNPCFDRIMT